MTSRSRSSIERVIARVLMWLAVLVATGCAGLPPRPPVVTSQALTGTADTSLGRIAAASRPAAETQPSGFRLLPTGEFALDARMALMRRAERSLDLQCYHIHRDLAGRLLLRELRDAAARGVRVRLLVDDLYVPEVEDLLAGLAAQPNVEVRLFNPMPLRRGSPVVRLLLSPGEFEVYNHRMHNKLFVADNQMAIYGGRNIADEYFMGNAEANFIDLDVLSTGAVVGDLSAAFDRYWNSEVVWPLHALRAPAANADEAAALRAAFDAAVAEAAPAAIAYEADPAGHSSVGSQLAQGHLAQVYAQAHVFADPPEKARSPVLLQRPTAAMQGLLDAIAGARHRVSIVSPYFVPSEVGMAMMRRAASHGVHTLLFTNSLGSTDEPLVHDHYSRYRADMLRIGVEIYEFSPELTQRSRGFGLFGRSTPRLHAKVAVVDGQRLLVGSVNLDARSAIGNTEMGVVIDSPTLAERLGQLMTGDQYASMYRLRLAADGQRIAWTATDVDGRHIELHDEPGLGAWTRFKLWLQSFFVEERML